MSITINRPAFFPCKGKDSTSGPIYVNANDVKTIEPDKRFFKQSGGAFYETVLKTKDGETYYLDKTTRDKDEGLGRLDYLA